LPGEVFQLPTIGNTCSLAATKTRVQKSNATLSLKNLACMMQKKYARLTFTERIEIEKLLSHKKSYFDIASVLNGNKSTIQRDIAKQGRDSYKAMKAECQAVGNSSNRKDGKNKINACEALGK